jgi:hypothetical protein
MTRPEQAVPTTQREPAHAHAARHAARVVVPIILGVVVLAVLAGVTLRLLPHPPQIYGGSGTETDNLTQVVTDPAGGLWAIGERLGENQVTKGALVSTFILHSEHGHWVTAYSRDASIGSGVERLAMVSADEGWAVGTALDGGLARP